MNDDTITPAPPMADDKAPKRGAGGQFLPKAGPLDAPDKPKRGRPKGSKGRKKRERAPKRQAPRRQSLQDECLMLVTLANTGIDLACRLGGLPPDWPLDEQEAAMVADALAAEFKAHPQWRDMLHRAVEASPHLLMAQALTLIVVRRLGRDDLLPGINGKDEDAAAVPMGPGRAHGDPGGYGLGEVNARGGAPDGAPLPDHLPLEV